MYVCVGLSPHQKKVLDIALQEILQFDNLIKDKIISIQKIKGKINITDIFAKELKDTNI